jgi:hypothetical protein
LGTWCECNHYGLLAWSRALPAASLTLTWSDCVRVTEQTDYRRTDTDIDADSQCSLGKGVRRQQLEVSEGKGS